MSDNIVAIKPLEFPWETQDPFLFCAYHRDEYPAGDESMGVDERQLKGRIVGQDFELKDGWRMYHGSHVPGFPHHPHRGFETITINRAGVIDHSDSLGASGRFMKGDVQWMTAGRGIQHAEMFPLLNVDDVNPTELFQIWLNLPKDSKFVNPHFKMLWREKIPVVVHRDQNQRATTIDVIAGQLGNFKGQEPTPDSWAADDSNEVGVFTIRMEPHATWTLPKISSWSNRSIYFYQGDSITVDDEKIIENIAIYAIAAADITITNGSKEAFLLILQGKPINETVVQHGPFVMNTQEEIREAISDYQNTQFGGWPWGKGEVVHARSQGRFARHATGEEELMDS